MMENYNAHNFKALSFSKDSFWCDKKIMSIYYAKQINKTAMFCKKLLTMNINRWLNDGSNGR